MLCNSKAEISFWPQINLAIVILILGVRVTREWPCNCPKYAAATNYATKYDKLIYLSN